MTKRQKKVRNANLKKEASRPLTEFELKQKELQESVQRRYANDNIKKAS